MAVTADSVVVELEARVAGYNAAVADAANKTDAAFTRIGASAKGAEGDITRSTARIANAQRNLGRQFADVGASLSSGASPFVILGQQSAQVADALADTGGRAAKVAAFFAGPWGAALLAAGSVLAVFAEKALKGGESVDALVEKLQASEDKANRAALAEDIFAISLDGAAKASRELNERLQDQNKSQIQVAQSALAAAESVRQLTIQNLRNEASRASIAQANATAARTQLALGPGGNDRAAVLGAQQKQADAARRLATAQKAVADAERATVEARIPLLKLDAAGAADRGTAALQRQERTVNKLTEEYRRASGAASLFSGKTREAAQAAADRAFIQGTSNAARTLEREQDAIRESEKKPRKKKGPSAATLAARAERARVREVRTDEQFNTELERLNGEIISQKLSESNDAGEIANLRKQQVQSELDRRLIAIKADEDAKKYSELQGAQLREKAREIAAMKNLAIASEEIRQRSDEALQSQRTALDNQQTLAQAQLSIATSNEERKRIEAQLLEIKYKELELAQRAILADTTGRYSEAQRADAQSRLNALPALRQADQVGLQQRYMGEYERYRQNMSSADSLSDEIDRIKIGTLESVTDELTRATTAALGLKGAFGDIVGELIRIGIQRRLIGPLADALFGSANGTGGGGLLGSILPGIIGGFGGGTTGIGGTIPGRASGGNVMAGKAYMTGERGRELFVPSQSGKIYATGALNAAASQRLGPTIVQQSFVLDARGGVVTQDLLRQVNQLSTSKAAQAGKAAYDASPSRLAKRETLGT